MLYLIKDKRGSVLVFTLIILGVLVFLSTYFISFTTRGAKMSESQRVGTIGYYLAEAGIEEAIWKLKNDETDTDGDDPWKECFAESAGSCNCSTWQDSFSHSYATNTTTTVSIRNVECARGEIVATSTVKISSDKSAQRVVKVSVFKSLGSLVEDSPVFAGSPSGESDIVFSNLNVYDGNIFGNNNIKIKYWSDVGIYDNPNTSKKEGKLLAVGNLILSWGSNLTSDAICTKEECSSTSTCECEIYPDKFDSCSPSACPPVDLAMPAIDFDSESPNSYKSKAEEAEAQGLCSVVGKDASGGIILTDNKCVFTEGEFSDLLWQVGQEGELILEHSQSGDTFSVYYVEGGVELKGGRYLKVEGILAADKSVNIGEKYDWKKDEGFNQLTVEDPGSGVPSGVITKKKLNFGLYSSFRETVVEGILYSQDEMRMVSFPHIFEVRGGVIARKFSLTSIFTSMDIYLDNSIVEEGIWGGPNPPESGGEVFSPVITVDHWEESY